MEHWQNTSPENLKEFVEGIGWIEEQWKSIEGYESYYEISSFGRVRSLNRMVTSKSKSIRPLKGKMMRQRILDGYPKIILSRNGIYNQQFVHRLVANAFVDKIRGKRFVNHKFGNRRDNRFFKLEWMTTSENCAHGFRINGRISPNKNKVGKDSARSKPVILTNRFTGEKLNFESGHLATIKLKLTPGSLSRVLNGQYKYTKNYYAEFA